MKKKCRYGFTLVEVLIAIVLFATLSVAVYSILKGTMDSTLRQKTQQAVNENAKSLLKMAVDDLKSSTIVNLTLPLDGANDFRSRNYFYRSSVIFPATGQFSNTENIDGNEAFGFTNDGTLSVPNGFKNRFLFYTKSAFEYDSESNNSVSFRIVEYKTKVESGKCRVERNVYDPREFCKGHNLDTWPGLSLLNNVNNLEFSLQRQISFNGQAPSKDDTSMTVFELPNNGDISLIYVNRAWDDTVGVASRRFAANQYVVKVLVFQTMKNITETYFNADGIPNAAFTGLFIQEKDLNNTNKNKRRNYRYSEISSSVSVPAPSVH